MDFKLKSGKSAHIEIWHTDKLKQFLDGCYGDNKGKIQGFHYLDKNNATDFTIRKEPEYVDAADLSDLEKQEIMGLSNWNYHKTLATICEGELAGVWLFRWRSCYGEFWRYHSRFLDVKDKFKNQGVATAMIKALHQADFIQGRIVVCGDFTLEADKYIKNLVARELTAKNYALVSKDHYGPKPDQFGVYDSVGEFR